MRHDILRASAVAGVLFLGACADKNTPSVSLDSPTPIVTSRIEPEAVVAPILPNEDLKEIYPEILDFKPKDNITLKFLLPQTEILNYTDRVVDAQFARQTYEAIDMLSRKQTFIPGIQIDGQQLDIIISGQNVSKRHTLFITGNTTKPRWSSKDTFAQSFSDPNGTVLTFIDTDHTKGQVTDIILTGVFAEVVSDQTLKVEAINSSDGSPATDEEQRIAYEIVRESIALAAMARSQGIPHEAFGQELKLHNNRNDKQYALLSARLYSAFPVGSIFEPEPIVH